MEGPFPGRRCADINSFKLNLTPVMDSFDPPSIFSPDAGLAGPNTQTDPNETLFIPSKEPTPSSYIGPTPHLTRPSPSAGFQADDLFSGF